MKKKPYALSARGRRAVKSANNIPDDEIDFSDIPELSDDDFRRARRVGRPTYGNDPKQLIAIRIEPSLLQKLKKLASSKKMPYKTFIHHILEEYV